VSVIRSNCKPLHLEKGRQKIRKRKKEKKTDIYGHAKNVMNVYVCHLSLKASDEW
jgi:intracellular sulfur oxidation DsrE/DsrF family protein